MKQSESVDLAPRFTILTVLTMLKFSITLAKLLFPRALGVIPSFVLVGRWAEASLTLADYV